MQPEISLTETTTPANRSPSKSGIAVSSRGILSSDSEVRKK
jgi:hypothetical protein